MKSNRTHQPPPRVENLGEGTFYYNLNVIKYKPLDMDGNEMPYDAYDYDQIRVDYPINLGSIQSHLDKEKLNHKIKTDDFIIDADSGKVQSKDKEIVFTELPTQVSENALNNLKDEGWKINKHVPTL